MSSSLMIVSIIFSLFVIILMLLLLRKGLVSIKYSLVWIILFGLLFVALLVPKLMENLTRLLGFQTSSNMVLSLIIGLLVIINISLTIIVSSLRKEIKTIIQEVSINNSNLKM